MQTLGSLTQDDPGGRGNNSHPETAIVMGLRQLLAVLTIVVLLMGVFFAIGYLTGRMMSQPAPAGQTVPEHSRPAAGASPAQG